MTDTVNHPEHYTEGFSNGSEVIDITENLNFNRGNVVKYVTRAGKKNPSTDIEDLQKAQWYLQREIERLGSVLLQRPGYVWEDNSGSFWRWNENSWEYLDSDAGEWIDIHGWPSDKYKPFTLITTTGSAYV